MLNYILADYKRVLSRIPRIVFVLLYQAAFVIFLLIKHNQAAGIYTSVTLVDNASTIFGTWFIIVVCLIDFIQSFSFDFRAKTIQVALGIGISRLNVILAKLIQTTLVMLTDLVVTFTTFNIMAVVFGTPLAGHQLNFIICHGLSSVTLSVCSVSLLLPLVFRTQNMVMSMVGYFLLATSLLTGLIRELSRLAPEFITRLELDKFFYDNTIQLLYTNAIQHTFQLWPVIVSIAWFALGIYLGWLAFRKMELDF